MRAKFCTYYRRYVIPPERKREILCKDCPFSKLFKRCPYVKVVTVHTLEEIFDKLSSWKTYKMRRGDYVYLYNMKFASKLAQTGFFVTCRLSIPHHKKRLCFYSINYHEIIEPEDYAKILERVFKALFNVDMKIEVKVSPTQSYVEFYRVK